MADKRNESEFEDATRNSKSRFEEDVHRIGNDLSLIDVRKTRAGRLASPERACPRQLGGIAQQKQWSRPDHRSTQSIKMMMAPSGDCGPSSSGNWRQYLNLSSDKEGDSSPTT